MMGNSRLLFLGICLFFLLSCREDFTERHLLYNIEQVWQQCETSLPEARVRTESMRDSVQKSSAYVRQKYDLLTIRLRDKRNLLPSSPDSAMQATAYFEKRKDAVDKERAYYYLGSAYRDLKDYPRAVNYFMKTVEAARQSKSADTLIWQNALSQLGDLYMLQLNYEDALNAALQAVELAKQSGKNVVFYLTDVASAYEHLNDTLHCFYYSEQAYQIIRKENFPPKYGRTLSYMLTLCSKYNRQEKTETLLQHLLQLPENRRPHNYELCLARFYEEANHTDSAILHYKTYVDKVYSMSGKYEASAGLQRCYLQNGDFRQAALWGSRLYEINDSIIAQRAFEETQRAKDSYTYYRNMEEEQAIVLRDERIKFISAVTLLALLSVVLGMMAFYNFRKKKFMDEIFDKEKMLEQRNLINKELTRIALMNNATGKAEDVIAHFRDIAAGRSRLKDGSWEALMTAIETLYPDFLEAVQGRMQRQMRESLLHTICLLKIGLKPVQISKVMDAKIQTVWNRVKRAEEICGDLLSV